jgi:hypothetical protein
MLYVRRASHYSSIKARFSPHLIVCVRLARVLCACLLCALNPSPIATRLQPPLARGGELRHRAELGENPGGSGINSCRTIGVIGIWRCIRLEGAHRRQFVRGLPFRNKLNGGKSSCIWGEKMRIRP